MIDCYSLDSPPAPSLTARPPTPRPAPTVGERASESGGGRLRLPFLSHHSGAAPALRSFRLLPSSVAPLAPLSSPQPTGVSLCGLVLSIVSFLAVYLRQLVLVIS